MRRIILFSSMVVLTLLISGCDDNELDGDWESEYRSYTGISVMDVTVVTGDVIVSPSLSDSVLVELNYNYATGCWEPMFAATDDHLSLSGNFLSNTCIGKSEWELFIPDQTIVNIESATGDVQITAVDAIFNINGATGDIEIENSTVEGAFNLATGNINAAALSLGGTTVFSIATGNVSLDLAEKANHTLAASSATGRAVVNYGGNEVEGTFVFIARKSDGVIISPYPFDIEEEFTESGAVYMRKSFTRGAVLPLVTISTASGTAELRKD